MPRIRVVVVYSPQLVQDRQEFEACNENRINAIFNQYDYGDSICLFYLAKFAFCIRGFDQVKPKRI